MFKFVVNGKWVMVVKFYGDYIWVQYWMFLRVGCGIFLFVVEESCYEVYVVIFVCLYMMDFMYEIVIGGYNKWLIVL